jgi:hypothetical protein
MFQHLKLMLFAAAIEAASISQPNGLGYGAAVQMAAAVMQELARLISQWRRRQSEVSGNPLGARRLPEHSVLHV